MTEQEKQATLEAEAKAKAEAEQAEAKDADDAVTSESSEDDAEEAKKIDKEIDYEAENKLLKERLDKAERIKAEKRFRTSEKKREQEEIPPDEQDEDDKPLTKRELAEILAQNTQETEKRFMATRIKDIAKDLAGSDSEADYIVTVHKSRMWPSDLSLEEQIEEAQLIANKKRILGENSELKRALRAKSEVSNNSARTHHDAQKGVEPQLADDEKLVMQQSGFTWNSVARRYEKKLANGKILLRDPKTKNIKMLS